MDKELKTYLEKILKNQGKIIDMLKNVSVKEKGIEPKWELDPKLDPSKVKSLTRKRRGD